MPDISEDNIQNLGGVTDSERYLNYLAQRSFLSLWSYSNLYTDDGVKNGKGDGKELCDLMVIFDNQIILFSDKHCAFPNHPDITISWERWFKRAVLKSSRQLFGAEAWLRKYPKQIFLDRACKNPFPLNIPEITKENIHRIAVTRGSHDACRQHFGENSSGSLMINTSLIGDKHFKRPFQLGHIDPQKGFVHVLDEFSMNVVLKEMDTITDFISYLIKKENQLTIPGRVLLATGEEQLVAMYLKKINSEGEHDFVGLPSDVDGVMVDEGIWEDFVTNPQYLAKKEADKISYIWDHLIEEFAKNIISGRIIGLNRADTAYHEQAIRYMAAEPRVRRRQLAESLIGALEKASSSPGKRLARLGLSKEFPDTAYIFLIIPVPEGIKYEDYRETRKSWLLAYCKVAKLKASEAKRIIGIAMEPKDARYSSEDLIFLDFSETGWSKEHESEATEIQKEFSILLDQNIQYYETSDKEYPDITKEKTVMIENKLSPWHQANLNRAQRRKLLRNKRKKK